MTIECYDTKCKSHSIHYNPYDGPFCDELECKKDQYVEGGAMEETVTITKKEYEELKEDSNIYNALRAAGVDNWIGWDDAMELLDEGQDEN